MKIAACAAALAGLLAASTVQAAPIAAGSELSLNGSDSFTATSISFTNPSNIGGTSGSFAAALGAIPPEALDAATLFDFTSASSGFELYTATANGATSTLVNAVITAFDFTPGALETLVVRGTGTLTLTGFADTPGVWDLTSQGPGGATTVTFSNSAVATGVLEPSALALLGGGLLALGLWGWRRGAVAA